MLIDYSATTEPQGGSPVVAISQQAAGSIHLQWVCHCLPGSRKHSLTVDVSLPAATARLMAVPQFTDQIDQQAAGYSLVVNMSLPAATARLMAVTLLADTRGEVSATRTRRARRTHPTGP